MLLSLGIALSVIFTTLVWASLSLSIIGGSITLGRMHLRFGRDTGVDIVGDDLLVDGAFLFFGLVMNGTTSC